MPQTILGLDIRETAVAAVLLEKGLQGRRILACAHAAVGEAGSIGEALQELAGRISFRAHGCHTAVPAEQASYRQVRLPFEDARKIRQALPFEMEPALPFPIEEMLVDFSRLPGERPGPVLAAAVNKAWVSEHLALLRPLAIDPAVLDIQGVPVVSWLVEQKETPEQGLLLDLGMPRTTMILFAGRRILLIRSLALDASILTGGGGLTADGETPGVAGPVVASLCRQIRNTLHAFESQARAPAQPETAFVTGMASGPSGGLDLLAEALQIPVREVRVREEAGVRMDRRVQALWDPATMTHALALALREPKSSVGFNFRRDGFEVKSSSYLGFRKELRTAAVFLFLAMSMLALDLGLDYHRLKMQSDALNLTIAQVFREAFPGVTRVVAPLQQMKIKMAELRRSASPGPPAAQGRGAMALDLLKDMSERISPSLDVRLSRLVLDADTVRISGETDTFNTVESLKGGLEASGYFRSAAITSASLDRTGGKVRFEIALEQAHNRAALGVPERVGAAGLRQGDGALFSDSCFHRPGA